VEIEVSPYKRGKIMQRWGDNGGGYREGGNIANRREN